MQGQGQVRDRARRPISGEQNKIYSRGVNFATNVSQMLSDAVQQKAADRTPVELVGGHSHSHRKSRRVGKLKSMFDDAVRELQDTFREEIATERRQNQILLAELERHRANQQPACVACSIQ